MNLRFRWATFLTIATIFGLCSGCAYEPTGGTGSKGNKGGQAETGDGALSLVYPKRVELQNNGSQEIEVSVNRGSDTNRILKVSLQSGLPRHEVEGIRFAPADFQLNAGQSSQKVTASATSKAKPGTYSWKLILRSMRGEEATGTMEVVVGP